MEVGRRSGPESKACAAPGGDTMTGGADMGGVDALSLMGDVSCLAAAVWTSAANSRVSLECLPTLPKGLMMEVEEAASGSGLSRFRELDL